MWYLWVRSQTGKSRRLLAKYDLLALPVLDGEERMVGIVTVMMPWMS